MDALINLYAGATGLWKKVAALLPLIAGAGSVLIGAGSILVQLSHAADAAAALHLVSALGPTDPNVVMIMAGLTALGIHTNHAGNAAQLADHADVLDQTKQLLPPQPQPKP